MTATVKLYSSSWCPFCVHAKQLLASKQITIDEILVDGEPEIRQQMVSESGQFTVPQIWIGAQHVGGCDDLYALERAGKLDALLAQA
jgi:glutaredoxin 3